MDKMFQHAPLNNNGLEKPGKFDHRGLSPKEVEKLLETHGPNEIIRATRVNPWKILLRQFSSPLILILIAAAFISFGVGFLPGQDLHVMDTILIAIIVVMSGIMGFIQDYNAEKTIEALQKMDMPKAKVIRAGHKLEIDSKELVPGDLLEIESGDLITADGVLIESFHLKINESVLTGESAAVNKAKGLEVFKNTAVASGHGLVRVSATGMRTKIGNIADSLQNVEIEQSNFQKEIKTLSKKLSIITLIITLLIAVVGIFKFGFYVSILTAISLAVAAIPEGLPAVMVLALALGAGRMFKRNALIRKLSIVESVGAVDIICTDKTGTLTLNEMTVTRFFYDNEESAAKDFDPEIEKTGTLKKLLICGAVCNNATLLQRNSQGSHFVGDQTEIALKKAAFQYLHNGEDTIARYYRIDEIPFSSERKMMSIVAMDTEGNEMVFSKGAPEVLLEHCDKILINGKKEVLSNKYKKILLQQNKKFAGHALRVLGFAYKTLSKNDRHIEQNLVWIGLQAMIDPPRSEAKNAIADCLGAGIRVIIITGDNAATTQAIANQVGLRSRGVIEGKQIELLSDEELQRKIKDGVNIFARTDPFHKLRILELLEEENTVAMTGDGVNDALAIRRAVVGISMGKKGTEVAKQASDIVLLDDNFSTIRDAVREGRTIFNNIRKFIDYLLTCNLAEVALIFFITIFFGFDEPVFYPIQLLWVNLLTDGLVALALGMDPPANDVLLHPPRQNEEPLINKRLAWSIGLIGLKKAIVLMVIFVAILPQGLDLARSTLLTGIVLFEFVRIGVIRHHEMLGWFDNKWLVVSLLGSLLLHILIVYSPVNKYFYLVPLGVSQWSVLLVGVVLAYFLAILITKLIRNKIQ